MIFDAEAYSNILIAPAAVIYNDYYLGIVTDKFVKRRRIQSIVREGSNRISLQNEWEARETLVAYAVILIDKYRNERIADWYFEQPVYLQWCDSLKCTVTLNRGD